MLGIVKRLSSKQTLALVLLAFGVLVWVGCGEAARTVSTSSLTKAEFVNHVEAICARGRLRGLHFQPAGEGQSERDAITEAIDTTLLPAIQGVIDQIYALGAPRKKRAQTEALLTALQQAVDKGEALDIPTVQGVEGLLARPGRLARKAGLQSCVYG